MIKVIERIASKGDAPLDNQRYELSGYTRHSERLTPEVLDTAFEFFPMRQAETSNGLYNRITQDLKTHIDNGTFMGYVTFKGTPYTQSPDVQGSITRSFSFSSDGETFTISKTFSNLDTAGVPPTGEGLSLGLIRQLNSLKDLLERLDSIEQKKLQAINTSADAAIAKAEKKAAARIAREAAEAKMRAELGYRYKTSRYDDYSSKSGYEHYFIEPRYSYSTREDPLKDMLAEGKHILEMADSIKEKDTYKFEELDTEDTSLIAKMRESEKQELSDKIKKLRELITNKIPDLESKIHKWSLYPGQDLIHELAAYNGNIVLKCNGAEIKMPSSEGNTLFNLIEGEYINNQFQKFVEHQNEIRDRVAEMILNPSGIPRLKVNNDRQPKESKLYRPNNSEKILEQLRSKRRDVQKPTIFYRSSKGQVTEIELADKGVSVVLRRTSAGVTNGSLIDPKYSATVYMYGPSRIMKNESPFACQRLGTFLGQESLNIEALFEYQENSAERRIKSRSLKGRVKSLLMSKKNDD